MKLTKTSTKIRLGALALIASLLLTLLSHERAAFAQGGFEGDYDTSFATNGYYVDPESPFAPDTDTWQTYFHTGELLPGGSIIAGGRHVDNGPRGDFYLRKFTPTGAFDTSFGTNGIVRTNFHTDFNGVGGDDQSSVLRVQPDGKIVFAGKCVVGSPSSTTPTFGSDACVIRYNANGTLDQTFGGFPVHTTGGGPGQVHSIPIDPGKVIFQTGVRADGGMYGTDGNYIDMAIQPDGKIILVGETRNFASVFVAQGYGAIVVRLNPNGSRDTTFGDNGIARWTAPEGPANCFPPRSLHGVLLQQDGRIIAVGYNSVSTCSGSQATGNRFVVTRWTAAGQLETVRHFDNNTAFDFQDERAVSAHLTRDGSKILVSGSYRNLSGTPAGRQKPTMVRLNIGDLSLDTSFGNGGIVQYDRTFDNSTASTIDVKAIQPDGKIIGVDNVMSHVGGVVRFNPDGSSDQSFGNVGILDGSSGGRGRLSLSVTNYNGFSNTLHAGQILVRPNGRINLIGYSIAFDRPRAVVSQQNTELPSYTLAGRVLAGSGAAATGVSGVTVKLTGSKTATTTTNPTGNYSFSDVPLGGNYTVTPSKAGLSMTPVSKSFANLSADQLNVNFNVPSLSLNNVRVTEGNAGATTTATFTVKLSPASADSVTVKYKTLNGTATTPADYTALPLTLLTFAPGQISKTVTVQVKGDALDEANETFKLLLSAPTKAVIADQEGVCTITDNDALPSITISDARVTEPDSGTILASFTVRLSAVSGQTVSVKYATANGTATTPADYTAMPLTQLTFTPGQTTKTVTVQVKGDTVREANETFFVNLSGAVNGAITDAKGLGTITNDD